VRAAVPPQRILRAPAVATGALVVLVMLTLVGSLLPAGAAASDDGHARPLQPVLARDAGEGFVPPPMTTEREEWDETDAVAPAPLLGDGALPSVYDLRPLDRLSPVRDQGPFGTCWSFAAMASLESGLLPGVAADYSEDNMVLRSGYGFADPYDRGGNDLMATAYLTRWAGPVTEADDAYGDGVSPASATVRLHLQDVVWVPSAQGTDNEALKQAVAAYGAVSVSFYWSSSYYEALTASYYMPPGVSSHSNHAVAIVGWDDGYSRTRFRTAPPGDGAWLVRNSWGGGWGSSGYFHVSYYDPLIGVDGFAYSGAEAADNYDRVYQYDTLGLVNSYGYSSQTGWFATSHTAAADEELAAVSFYALVPGTSYEVWAGKDLSTPDGTRMERVASGELDEAGYRTVALPTALSLAAGERFVVAVKVTTPGETYPIPIEMRWWGYSDQSQGAPGQSYLSRDGTAWTDFDTTGLEGDVCLKAFCRDAAAEPEDPAPDDPDPVDPPAEPDESTPPETTAGGSGSAWRRTAATVTFAADDEGSGVARTEYRLDGGAWTTAAQGGGAASLESALQVGAPADHSNDGVHLIEYRSVDVAGNVEPVKTRRVRIDTRRPKTRVTRKMSVRRGRRAVVRFRVTDTRPGATWARVSVVVRRRGHTVRTIRLSTRRPVNRTLRYSLRCNLPRGTYKVYVRATDAAGNRQLSVRSATLTVR